MQENLSKIFLKKDFSFGKHTTKEEKFCAIVSGVGMGVAISAAIINLPEVVACSAFAEGVAMGEIGCWEIIHKVKRKDKVIK